MENEFNYEDKKYTFWDLIKKYEIKIPMIQRDYVQGKKNKKINIIRKKLIDNIELALKEEKNLDFDFIYGSTKINEKGNKELSLLDGQQRITTLFLLHWYFAVKENKMTEEVKKIMHNFSYQNRVSSRDFCDNLVDKKIEIKKEPSLSTQIKEKIWYYSGWDNDPTIRNMLNMLDCIHDNFFMLEAFENLTDENKKIISFNFIPLERFNLTDELYIKMNSRGKKLTNFEIFKSKIIEIMKQKKEDKTLDDLSKKKVEKLLDDFSKKVEEEWASLFIEYRRQNEITIDEIFMRYIYYITEMIYATRINTKTKKDSELDSPFEYNKNEVNLDIKLIEETYKDIDNIKLLIDILDIWKTKEELNNDINKAFNTTYIEKSVTLFKDKQKSNLFENCIYSEKFELLDKILLYAFLLKKKNNKEDNNYDDIRIIRNIILNVRTFSRPREEYNSNMRYYMLREFFEIFENIIKEKNPYSYLIKIKDEIAKRKEYIIPEIEKAILINENPELKKVIFECEDTIATQGNLSNILDLIKIYKEKTLDFIKIFSDISNYLLIYRTMLSFDNYGIYIGGSSVGYRYFYGASDTIYDIVTYNSVPETQEKIKNILKNIFENLQNKHYEDIKLVLNNIINENITKLSKSNWIYNLSKYEDIWNLSYERIWEGHEKDKIVYTYTMKSESDSKVSDIEISSLSRRATNSRHISPYYKPILNYYNIEEQQKCYSTKDDNGKIVLNNGIIIQIAENGFQISSNDKIEEIQKVLKSYIIDQEGKIFVQFNKDLDYIEQEKNIIDEIINI